MNPLSRRVATPDLRPAVVLDHVEDATVNGLVDGGDVTKAATPLSLGAGAARAQVRVRA